MQKYVCDGRGEGVNIKRIDAVPRPNGWNKAKIQHDECHVVIIQSQMDNQMNGDHPQQQIFCDWWKIDKGLAWWFALWFLLWFFEIDDVIHLIFVNDFTPIVIPRLVRGILSDNVKIADKIPLQLALQIQGMTN